MTLDSTDKSYWNYWQFRISCVHQEPVAFFQKHRDSPRFSMLSQAGVYSRFADLSFVTRNAVQLHTIALKREYINGRLTYPSIVLVINDHSRSTHTDARIAAPTDRQTKICYCTRRRRVADNRALQANLDSRNRNIPCMQYSK